MRKTRGLSLKTIHPMVRKTRPNFMCHKWTDLRVQVSLCSCLLIDVQIVFLSKVYSLLVVQLVVFTGVVCMNIFIPQLRTFNTRYIIVAIPIVILALLFYCITYCFRKLFPVNLMLLGIWTILVSWPIGMICSFYQIYAVLLTLALTLFVLVWYNRGYCSLFFTTYQSK